MILHAGQSREGNGVQDRLLPGLPLAVPPIDDESCKSSQ